VARSTADFASTTSMTEGRLRLRTASRCCDDPEAAFLLFSVIPLDGLSTWIWGGERKEEEGGEYDGGV